jgi:ADP-L-glycero-D-manno-heptose 6-epimerase
MIIVTGGSGFIGSALVWRLNKRGVNDIVIVDHLGETEKWKNLVSLQFSDYFDKSDFIKKLEFGYFGSSISAIFHLGACSSTTERDADYLIENNYRYTARLATWQEEHRACRLIYASSAATYGDGEQGYRDKEDELHLLRPLNIYGYSKHMFDLLALRKGWLQRIVGLKYFNVFGPNEYHKGEMRSLINKAYTLVRDEGKICLFKSYRDEYKDGEQLRDFIYVKNAVDMTLFFFDNPKINGIFNIGTGDARSWNEVAASLFQAVGRPLNIEYIPMPDNLKEKYQYYTCADMTKLRSAGYSHTFMDIDTAIKEYVLDYLNSNKHLSVIRE